MKIGVFVPIGNNGWLISTHAPQYMPTFELNKAIVQKAEHYHFDFALSMIKLRGFGGKTEFWDHNLESFTLMAGLAAVTSRIQIYATAATLTLPPAIVARMAATIDSISGGRFGVNLVTGWQKPVYEQMGIWPGDDYFSRRYDYLTEYVQVLRDLWGTGKSDFKVIETAGGTMADVTFNSIFITDWKNYAAINEIYAEFFPGDKPARFCIQCGLVKPDALVEIATIAHIAK